MSQHCRNGDPNTVFIEQCSNSDHQNDKISVFASQLFGTVFQTVQSHCWVRVQTVLFLVEVSKILCQSSNSAPISVWTQFLYSIFMSPAGCVGSTPARGIFCTRRFEPHTEQFFIFFENLILRRCAPAVRVSPNAFCCDDTVATLTQTSGMIAVGIEPGDYVSGLEYNTTEYKQRTYVASHC